MKRLAQVAGLLLAAGFVAIQFVPVRRTSRLGSGDPDAARMLRLPLDGDAMADLGVRRADVMAGGAGRRPRT